MKKILYITGIIGIIAVCGSISYYFIMSANQKFSQQKVGNEVTQQNTFEKKKKCNDMREGYIKYLNDTRYKEKDSDGYFTEVGDAYIFYNSEYDSCLGAHRRYGNQRYGQEFYTAYSINDYLNGDNEIFYCISPDVDNCLEKWEEKIKELGK